MTPAPSPARAPSSAPHDPSEGFVPPLDLRSPAERDGLDLDALERRVASLDAVLGR